MTGQSAQEEMKISLSVNEERKVKEEEGETTSLLTDCKQTSQKGKGTAGDQLIDSGCQLSIVVRLTI